MSWLERFISFVGGRFFLSPLLRFVSVEPTNACTLSCDICPRFWGERKVGYMTFEFFQEIVDELSTFWYSVQVALNFYGESLLHSQFSMFVDYALTKRLGVFLHTNGAFIDKVDLPFGKDGFTVVLSDHNVDVNPDFIKYFDHVNIVQGDNTKGVDYWLKHGKKVRVHPAIQKDLTVNVMQRKEETKFCASPFSGTNILWNGDVTLCCYDGPGINVIGNVTDKSILKFWKSDIYKQVRRDSLTLGKPNMPLCKTCNVWKFRNNFVDYNPQP